MKNSIVKILAFAGLAIIFTGCSSNDDFMVDSQANLNNKTSKEASKTQTYHIRYGLLSSTGTKILSGNYDVGSFIATNNNTGESYDTYASGGFQSLPKYYDGIPAGTYTFTAMQGQGGWVGYGSVVGVVSDAQLDADGYVTVYIPIAWEE